MDHYYNEWRRLFINASISSLCLFEVETNLLKMKYNHRFDYILKGVRLHPKSVTRKKYDSFLTQPVNLSFLLSEVMTSCFF